MSIMNTVSEDTRGHDERALCIALVDALMSSGATAINLENVHSPSMLSFIPKDTQQLKYALSHVQSFNLRGVSGRRT